MDLFLKQGSGLSVIESCRARASHQHVVILTNYATAQVRQRALQLGADAVFDKSTEIEDLLAYLERLSSAPQPSAV